MPRLRHDSARGSLRARALALAVLAAAAGPARAQVEADEAIETAGTRYRAGWLHRLLFGDDYRALWAAPVQIEVLDLGSFAGGLAPVRRVGAGQSSGLALRGADGRAYTFRGVEKDATRGLPPELQRTIAGRIAQDQVAAMHPAAPVVTVPLLAAAGVLHVEPRLVVMPDDPRLGDFRADFANVLGTIQEYPRAAAPGQPGFAGATEILDTEELLPRLRASPAERVDARAFLRARLVDLFLGDWDRHAGQWRWARIPGEEGLQPIPEDRDFAFCRFEGLVLAIARNWSRRWVEFGETYPDVLGLTWQAWPLDRALLTGLERADWEAVAADLRDRLDDAAIAAAVARLPDAYRRLDGARLEAALRARRDRLPEVARRFYRHLAEEVRVDATDGPDVAAITALPDGVLEVTVAAAGSAEAPWYRRRFRFPETKEVRLDLGGGDDRLAVHGRSAIRLRILGGPGDDRLDDGDGGGARLADWEGTNAIVPGPGTEVDTRPYTPPPLESETPWLPARDWGRQTTWLPWFAASPELGAFLGAGLRHDRFGFRTFPYASRQLFRAGFATAPNGFRVDYDGAFRAENTRTFLRIEGRASDLEILRFFGLGNETRATAPRDEDGEEDDDEEYFEVRRTVLLARAAVHAPLGRALSFSAGPSAAWGTTFRPRDSFIGILRPYGSGEFGQIGLGAELRLDTRDEEAAPARGVLVTADATVHPAVWDVREAFGSVRLRASGVVTARRVPLRPSLALRAGGERVFGTYPFHEAAFVGGPGTVRGFAIQRFAGDAGAWGGAELRVRAGRYDLVLPGEWGLFALADAGRVWLDGEPSRRWHAAAGGGLWFAYVDPNNTVTLAVARSGEKTGFYVRAGFLH